MSYSDFDFRMFALDNWVITASFKNNRTDAHFTPNSALIYNKQTVHNDQLSKLKIIMFSIQRHQIIIYFSILEPTLFILGNHVSQYHHMRRLIFVPTHCHSCCCVFSFLSKMISITLASPWCVFPLWDQRPYLMRCTYSSLLTDVCSRFCWKMNSMFFVTLSYHCDLWPSQFWLFVILIIWRCDS